MTLGEKSIRFDFEKSGYRTAIPRHLEPHRRRPNDAQGVSIYVYGYTDDIGTQLQLKLSGRRAQAVRNSLVRAGIIRA